MTDLQQPQEKDPLPTPYKVMMVTTGLTGFVTVGLLGIAIFVGLWLDKTVGVENHLFTIGLIILSVPLNVAALFWVARFTTQRYGSKQQENETQESN